MRISKKTIIPFFILFILLISEIFMEKINILRYCDEFVAVLMFIYILFILITKKSVEKGFGKIILFCFIVLLIGLLSNFLSMQQTNYSAVALDIVANFKLPVICIGFIYMLGNRESKEIAKILNLPCKIMIILGFLCSLISLFIDIGMRGQFRFGLWGFNFIFEYANTYALMELFCLIIMFINNISDKNNKCLLYIIFVSVQLALSLKGPALISSILLFALPFFIKNAGKIKKKHIMIIAIFSVMVGTYQIQTYFLNDNAPRAILMKYGIKTANNCFPIGSGFATYGSDMAAKYYSNLYRSYGFNNLYGMNSINYQFLNDNYWPSIVGQFGYIGMVLVLVILFDIFKAIQKLKVNYRVKSLLLVCYIYVMISSLGNTIFTTSATIIMSIGMILLTKAKYEGEDNNV